jgi:uncharacterized protein (DUF885 family)
MIVALSVVALASATPLQSLSQEYLRELWRTSPMDASHLGHHQDGVDQKLDDLSAAERARRLRWLDGFARRLETAAATTRDAEDQADATLMRYAVALERLDLAEAQSFRRRCDTPLGVLGSTFFDMATKEYAPLERRAADVVARLKAVPRYLAQAQAGLDTNVEEYRRAAKDDGAGLADYLEHTLPPAFAASTRAPALSAAATNAAEAVRAYLRFVDGELGKKPASSFRQSQALYDKRFAPYLQTDATPATVLASAKARMVGLHAEMAKLSRQILAGRAKGSDREVIAAALKEVAIDHPRPEALFATVKQQIEAARAFIVEHKLLTLVGQDNLQVIETPPFLRSRLSVAAFHGAPPLRPSEGAFYYVTPFPKEWPAEKVEAKLREYNRWMLDLTSVHEAMPGHYVQRERANQVQPETRRVLRAVLGSGAYIEGWGVYVQEMMVESGYRGGDPRLKLTEMKFYLRTVVNAILDIELQRNGLDDAAALKLMMDDGFQEQPEAEGKLRRAKLSVTQLCSYFVGAEAWLALRKEMVGAGAAIATGTATGTGTGTGTRTDGDVRSFHDRALAEGPVALGSLRGLLKAQ